MTENEAQARQRFFALSLIRLASTAMVVVGLLILANKLAAPRALGAVLAILGLLELVLLPRFLVSRWKTPER